MKDKKEELMAPLGYKIYPNSSPEFKIVQKLDGTIEHRVRYINRSVGYTGLWMKIEVEKE